MLLNYRVRLLEFNLESTCLLTFSPKAGQRFWFGTVKVEHTQGKAQICKLYIQPTFISLLYEVD